MDSKPLPCDQPPSIVLPSHSFLSLPTPLQSIPTTPPPSRIEREDPLSGLTTPVSNTAYTLVAKSRYPPKKGRDRKYIFGLRNERTHISPKYVDECDSDEDDEELLAGQITQDESLSQPSGSERSINGSQGSKGTTSSAANRKKRSLKTARPITGEGESHVREDAPVSRMSTRLSSARGRLLDVEYDGAPEKKVKVEHTT